MEGWRDGGMEGWRKGGKTRSSSANRKSSTFGQLSGMRNWGGAHASRSRRKKSRPHADRQNGWRMSSTAAAINWSAAAQRDRPRAAHTLTAHNSPRWPAHQGGPPKHAAHAAIAGERKSQTSTTNFRPQAIHVPKGWSAKFYPS